jgi:LuxR family transcriptional regulator, maltose regulon positive regulatory protein
VLSEDPNPSFQASGHRLAPPHAGREAQPRQRLFLPGRRATVTTCWASAGTGKTVLLAEWGERLRKHGEVVLWTSLAPPEADASTLQDAVTAAWNLALHHDASGPRPDGIRWVKGDLVTLFLDDVHNLTSEVDSEWLLHLLSNPPGGLRIVMAGRYLPPKLMRMNLLVEVAEFHADDLAFTEAEARRLLTSRGLALDDQSVRALMAYTGGWAAALVLLADRLDQTNGSTRLPPGFLDDPRSVGDYLVTEVLSGLPADHVDFLLATSVIDSFTVPLAVQLTDRNDAGEMIHQLAAHLALISADTVDGDTTYTYHPILRGFLRAEARRRDFGTFVDTMLIASDWHYSRGELREALDLAIRADDVGRVAHIVEAHGIQLVFDGLAPQVHDALTYLERDGRLSPAAHLVSATIASEFSADSSLMEYHLAESDDALPALPPVLRVLHAALSLLIATPDDRPQALAVLTSREQEIVSVRSSGTASDVAEAHLFSLWARARVVSTTDPPAAIDLLLQAVDLAGPGSAWLYLRIIQDASWLAARLGRWAQAVSLDELVVDVPLVSRHPTDLAVARAQLARSSLAFREGMNGSIAPLDDILGSRVAQFDKGLIQEAATLRLLLLLDRGIEERPLFAQLERLLLTHGRQNPRLVALAAYRLIVLTLKFRDREQGKEAVAFIRSTLGADAAESVLAFALYNDSIGRRLQGEHSLLSALATDAPSWEPMTNILQWLSLAWWADRSGRSAAAEERMVRAMEQASILRARRPFLARHGLGALMLENRLGRFGANNLFAESIVREFQSVTEADKVPAVDVIFTAKEREILSELPVHQSVGDIAHRLQLSPNTIKTHIRSIYQKLGVGNRADAVQHAGQAGLL